MAQEQILIAARDIPVPGSPDPTLVAYRAGDVIHPAWAEQHKDALNDLAAGGPELIQRVAPAKAGEASERAQTEQTRSPGPVSPAVP